MTQHSRQTAPTQFVDAAGVRFAYRRFGKSDGVSLVFNMHFTGTMDHWDPAVTDGFATEREVILFERRRRCDRLQGELVHPATERPERTAHPLPRL